VNRIAKVVCLDGLQSEHDLSQFSARAHRVSLQLL
jgi:hypothetical protein